MRAVQVRLVGVMAMAMLLPLAAVPSGAGQGVELACAATPGDICEYTVGREGVHRIELLMPSSATAPHEISISGQPCPLSAPAPDGAGPGVSLACFAYLSGGMTYDLRRPAQGRFRVTKADPVQGEPVTLIQ